MPPPSIYIQQFNHIKGRGYTIVHMFHGRLSEQIHCISCMAGSQRLTRRVVVQLETRCMWRGTHMDLQASCWTSCPSVRVRTDREGQRLQSRETRCCCLACWKVATVKWKSNASHNESLAFHWYHARCLLHKTAPPPHTHAPAPHTHKQVNNRPMYVTAIYTHIQTQRRGPW